MWINLLTFCVFCIVLINNNKSVNLCNIAVQVYFNHTELDKKYGCIGLRKKPKEFIAVVLWWCCGGGGTIYMFYYMNKLCNYATWFFKH